HGLQTGAAAIINGHTTNTNANGIWIVTVTGSTTFKISSFSGFPGTFINGNGVGGATGTVQSLMLPGITVPEDAVDLRDAASVNVPFEALADMTAWLAYKALASLTLYAGGSATFNNALTTFNQIVAFNASSSVQGLVATTRAFFGSLVQFA